MGKKELSKRENWQKEGGKKAKRAESSLYNVFYDYLKNTEYVFHKKPKHLKNLYSTVVLPPEVIAQIYNPDIDLSKKNWGIEPDFAIENTRTNKILFG